MQKTDKATIEKAIGSIRQKEKAAPKTRENTSAATGSASMSDAEVNAQANEYIEAVWSRVKQNWSIPQSLLPEKISPRLSTLESRATARYCMPDLKTFGQPLF